MSCINKCALWLGLIMAAVTCRSQQAVQEIRVAFYNCENLFDPADDPQKDDEEFTPSGKYHYTEELLAKRLTNMAKVVRSIEPAVMGVAEVENGHVLSSLLRQPALAARGYKYVLRPGPDPRGINVALIYDPTLFHVTSSESLPVNISGTTGKTVTRDVLHVQGLLAGEQVDIFVNHWPSRRGGEDLSGPKREAAARVNRQAIDAAMKKHSKTRVILMGDLNDNPDDRSITYTLGAVATKTNVTATGLYNPFANIYQGGNGTEIYRGRWNLFDQVIISGSLLRGKLKYDHAAIHNPTFLQDTYKGHEGEPHRAFKGARWINGYSDHYPVVVYLKK